MASEAAAPVRRMGVLKQLKRLSRERDQVRRQEILDAGHKAFMKWFTLTAKKILLRKIVLPKQTQAFMDRHRDDLQQLASKNTDLMTKRKIILKPGGGGFLGGTLIRTFLRWDPKKKKRAPTPKKKSSKKKRKTPKKKRKTPKRKTPKRKKKTPKRKKAPKKRKTPNTRTPMPSPSSPQMELVGIPPGGRIPTPKLRTPPYSPTLSPLRSSPSTPPGGSPYAYSPSSSPVRRRTPIRSPSTSPYGVSPSPPRGRSPVVRGSSPLIMMPSPLRTPKIKRPKLSGAATTAMRALASIPGFQFPFPP